MAASSAAAAATTVPIPNPIQIPLPTEAISEECKDDDALSSTLHTCANDPDFAVICAFLQKFAKDLGLNLPNFKHLQEWLTKNDEVPELRDLHIKLLRKTRKTVHEKSWESALSKFCFGYSVQDAWEIERFGYKNSSLKVKLRIFRELLESQFERNAKFRAHILTLNADTLRSEPIGRDRLGHAYWLTQDADCNLRIYQEHLDEEIWQVVATNRDEFVNLIARLRGNEVVLPSKDIGEADEDTSSSNSCPAKPPPPVEREEEEDDEEEEEQEEDEKEPQRKEEAPEVVKTVPNLKIKLRSPEQEEQKAKRVKPLLISQAKLGGSSSPAPAKKRSIEDVDSSPTAAAQEELKKQRPTLLDTKRIKKPSRYESTKDENEGESGEEEEEEGDEEEDSELDEGEEEEDDDEEDIDSAAADIEEDDDDDEDDEVGEAVEEPTVLVRGEGSGRENEAIPDYVFLSSNFNYDDNLEFSEIIEDPVLYVTSQGNGADCLVGNGQHEAPAEETTSTKTEPKATFFFGEPGCLKLSPMKQNTKPEAKRSIFDSLSGEEKTNGDSQNSREETPPRNGSELKESPSTTAAAALAASEKKPADPVTNETTISEETGSEEPESPANTDQEELKNNVKDRNTEISNATDANEELAAKKKDIFVQKSEIDGQSASLQLKPEAESFAEKAEPQEALNQKTERENGPVQSESKLEKAKENKLLDADQEKAECKSSLSSLSNDNVSTAKEVTKENQNKTETKTEPETETELTSTEDGSTKSEIKTQDTKLVKAPSEDSVKPEAPGKTADEDKKESPESLKPESPDNSTKTEPQALASDLARDQIKSIPSGSETTTSTEKEKLKENVQLQGVSASQGLASKDKIENTKAMEKSASDEKPIEAKPPPAPAPALPNRKRRLNDCQPAPRNSTSESDVHEEELPQNQLQDEASAALDDLDVGGKRIKMRPKTSNVEVRRKVEAQKTQIDETTSSSGEDDPRSRRKIIAPKRHLEKATPPANIKQKPTLAEIIEKKLKKTPEKGPLEKEVVEPSSKNLKEKEKTPPPPAKEVSIPASATKKSPVTKPLKKNLLTQLRQGDDSEEEAIPRKRTNSDNALPEATNPNAPLGVPEPSQHRKRRSSEEAKETSAKEVSPNESSPSAVCEKLKRNNEQDIKEEVETAEQEDPLALPAKDLSPPSAKEEGSPPEGSAARRSGRRGGAAVVYSELPQPKRTRGGAKEKSQPAQPDVKSEVKPESEDEDEEEKEQEQESTKTLVKPKAEMKKEEPKAKTEKEKSSDEEQPVKEEPKEQPKPKVGRGRGPRKKREVDTTNIIEATDSETPVRQSRRIAQQKIKEEAERRKLEEVALRSMKQELKKKKKAEKEADPTVLEPSGEESESEEASEAAEEEARNKKKKKCPGKDGGWSSDSEEQPESEEEEEEPPHYDTDPGSPLFRSDHEFSPESELEDESQVVPMKRARTVRKENAAEEEEDDAEEACQECGKSDHPEWILLCDTPACNKGYHCSCLSPVLFYIPEGDWHCPPCQQEQLIAALESQLQKFDALVAQKQQERRLAEEQAERDRRDREAAASLAANDNSGKRRGKDDDDDDEEEEEQEVCNKADKVKRRRGDGRSNRRAAKRGTRRRRGDESASSHGKSAGSGSASGSGSGSGSSSDSSSSFSDSDDEPIYKLRKRRQINVSYRLNEYDDLINSALKKEMDEVAGAGNLGRGKDISTIIEADKEKARREDQQQSESAPAASEANNENEKEKKPKDKSKSSGSGGSSSSDDEVLLKRSNKSTKQPPAKKKPRKLTTLDVSSEEDHGSDEDFKTSSYSDEDTSQSGSGDSDSSLEVYRRPGRGKKQRKAARRAARERRKDRKFVVEESDESEEEVQQRRSTKSGKKKKKEDSDYTETETDDDDENGSELSENVDSADLCDDTTSESDDGAWHPSKKKKKAAAAAKKSSSSAAIARKSPKLKKPASQPAKKVKRLEYSDDDISESEPEEDEEDDEDDDGAPLSGKGSGKQPRSQPLKSSGSSTAQSGKGKGKGKAKKKKAASSSDEEEGVASDDRTRTRGRRYAYIEEDDDSSDGGIKPGVHRPDTPPEERQKFIQRQEEIKRMLAEKNAEGAKLAATPRLTPIKSGAGAGGAGGTGPEKRTPGKAAGAGGDSLSTVPLSVIRQAKVLDIDYLQRKGEAIGDLDDVDESELDDAELPDDLPEDIGDAIARMVEEEEQFSAAVAARELPGAEEVLRTTPSKSKPASRAAPEAPVPPPSASGLQEPHRKRLPMPTMHPPLLRHQFPLSVSQGHHPPASLLPPQPPPPHGMHPMLQRHLSQAVAPPQAMQLLQNALSAPLGQPLGRSNYPPGPPTAQHLPLVMSMPSAAAAAHLMQSAAASAAVRPPDGGAAVNPTADTKPRGRRKKVTPLRDQLQKQQAAAAVTAATSSSGAPAAPVPAEKSKGQPQPLFKPHEDAANAPPGAPNASQASVITRMPAHLPLPHGRGHGQHGHGPPAGMYPSSAELARYYSQVVGQPPPASAASAGSRSPSSSPGPPRHLLRPQLPPGLPPPHSALRPTYGPPPPLRGSGPPASSASGAGAPNTRPPYLHGAEHHGGPAGPPMGGAYGSGPPPARHASPHLNTYRTPPIYGNPNYPPRVGGGPPGGPPGPPGNMRPGSVDFAAGARGYPPYGYYPPPPPLTTPPSQAPPNSVIVSVPPLVAPTNHSVSALTRAGKAPPPTGPPPQSAPVLPPTAPAPAPAAPLISDKPTAAAASVITSKKLTTLGTYPISKSPPAVGGEGSRAVGATNSPATIAEDDSGSAHDTTAPPAATGGTAVGEFSGLVSYFSSQQDDYDT